jgi:hypothetical protein
LAALSCSDIGCRELFFVPSFSGTVSQAFAGSGDWKQQSHEGHLQYGVSRKRALVDVAQIGQAGMRESVTKKPGSPRRRPRESRGGGGRRPQLK